jgi:hypothetical protein
MGDVFDFLPKGIDSRRASSIFFPTRSHKKTSIQLSNNKPTMGACKALICTLILSGLVIAGIMTWKFGPWYDTGKQNTESVDLTAATACEGCCNGLTSNCNLPVNEVLFPMVHNAMSSYEDYFVAANNNESLEKALVAGYRGLMLDSCLCDGGLSKYMEDGAKDLMEEIGLIDESTETEDVQKTLGFCHTYCDAGVRDPHRVLRNIKKFLDVNRNEVSYMHCKNDISGTRRAQYN